MSIPEMMSVLDRAFTPLTDQKGLVVLSGGQDSVTTLHYAMARHTPANTLAIGFNYGQRHRTELDQAFKVAAKYNVPYKVLDLSALRDVGHSALTGPGDVSKPHETLKDVPASFVPARNAMFLTLAHSYAVHVGAAHVYAGMCQTDYSGYPDCRAEFVAQLNTALNTGYLQDVVFDTPIMHIDKAETFALAEHLGGLSDVLELSHTCYEGDRSTRHQWGYGCGSCPACLLRAKGWEDYVERFVGGEE